MQDEYGRPLSDDGQWVWDGSAWRPTGGGAPGGTGPDPGTVALEPTMVAPRDYDPTGGQPQQPYGTGGYGARPGGPQHAYGPGGPYESGGPYDSGGPYVQGGPGAPGGPPIPTPFYKKPSVMIGALLVLSAVLVTIILETRGGGSPAAGPTPTVTATTPAPPTEAPTTEAPTTEAPTTEAPRTALPTTVSPTTPPPTSSLPSTISPGLYGCTSGGAEIGTATFAGTSYTTSTGASGTYQYDASSGDISFTGGDLGDFTGTYDPSGPSMELVSASGGELHCAQ
jgi:hypothetical protein